MFSMNAIPAPVSTSQATTLPAALTVGAGSDTAAAARQQLPSAVAAATNAAAYSPNAPQPPKPILRGAGTSPLAAQYIGQTPEASEEQLAVFEPPASPAAASAPMDEMQTTIADMRAARGEAPSAGNTQATAVAAQETEIPAAPALAQTAAYSAAPVQPSLLRSTPAPLVLAGKKPGIGEARGAAAYGIAAARNVAAHKPELDDIS